MRLSASLLAILSFLSLQIVSAVTLSGSIVFNELLSLSQLPARSKVSLDHGARKVWIRQDGSFELLDVDEGAHVVEPLVPGFIFHPLLVTVSPTPPNPTAELDQTPASPGDEDGATSPSTPTYTVHVQLHNPTREPLPPSSASLAHPLRLGAVGTEEYFTPPSGMNIAGLLKNPMVLMMLFSAIMMYALPKLTASMADMDPEMAKDVAETQKKMRGVQNMDWAGSLSNMLAGANEDAPALAPALPAASSSGTSTPNSRAGRGGKGRRGR